MSSSGQGVKWNEPTAPGVTRDAVVVVQDTASYEAAN